MGSLREYYTITDNLICLNILYVASMVKRCYTTFLEYDIDHIL